MCMHIVWKGHTQNDVGWDVNLYSLTHSLPAKTCDCPLKYHQVGGIDHLLRIVQYFFGYLLCDLILFSYVISLVLSSAGSRSSSPSSRMSYMTNSQQPVEYGRRTSASATTMHGYTRAALPRSQGNSREASPTRTLGLSFFKITFFILLYFKLCLKKQATFIFYCSVKRWSILIIFGMRHCVETWDKQLSLHYLMKFGSHSLAICNNEFMLDSTRVSSEMINWKATNTIGKYCIL